MNEEHEIGCPARYPDVGGDCDNDCALRRQLADRGYRLVDKLTPDDDRATALKRLGLDHEIGDDAPAGAGDSVEAYRG